MLHARRQTDRRSPILRPSPRHPCLRLVNPESFPRSDDPAKWKSPARPPTRGSASLWCVFEGGVQSREYRVVYGVGG